MEPDDRREHPGVPWHRGGTAADAATGFGVPVNISSIGGHMPSTPPLRMTATKFSRRDFRMVCEVNDIRVTVISLNGIRIADVFLSDSANLGMQDFRKITMIPAEVIAVKSRLRSSVNRTMLMLKIIRPTASPINEKG